MSDSNNALQALINAGADAQSNMYDVELEFADWNATVRADGFQIPEIEAPTYENSYHGVKLPMVKSEQNFERKFSLTFRMDAHYMLYDAFTELLSWHVDPNTGGVSNTAVGKVGTVKVRTLTNPFIARKNGNELAGSHLGWSDYNQDAGDKKYFGTIKEGKKWEFYTAFVTKVGQPNFKTEGGDKITFQVDFRFGHCKYPGFTKPEAFGKDVADAIMS